MVAVNLFRLARRSLPLPSLMCMEALYLASTISDVIAIFYLRSAYCNIFNNTSRRFGRNYVCLPQETDVRMIQKFERINKTYACVGMRR